MNNLKRIMALCDSEEEYAQLMTEFLKKHKDIPWEVQTYTSIEELLKTDSGKLTLLVVSEADFCQEMLRLNALRTVILNESGLMQWKDMTYIDKYQPAEEVFKILLQIYMEVADIPLPRTVGSNATSFLGFYSPVHRGLQTSTALTMGQLLSKDYSVLYLNFEYCAGIGELLPNLKTPDIADLLYFLNTEKDRFQLRMQTLCRQVGELKYIPPMRSGQNLLTITVSEWLCFLQKLEELGEYDYIILDLSDCLQGLFDILRMCTKIYTLEREDGISQSKMLQYEQLLEMCEYEDVVEKTKKYTIPHIQRIPDGLEHFTKGELASIVKRLLE